MKYWKLYYFKLVKDFFSVSGGFLGDIALPNIEYETEWRQQKLNKSFFDELEKYRDEVFKEGLQVEEEGLTGTLISIYYFIFIRKNNIIVKTIFLNFLFYS